MYSGKQKAGDAAAVTMEQAEILKVKAEEKEEKQIAKETRKAQVAEVKMKMHEAKNQHSEDKLHGKHQRLYGHGHHCRPEEGNHGPVGAAAAPTRAVVPTYPLGDHPRGWTAPTK